MRDPWWLRQTAWSVDDIVAARHLDPAEDDIHMASPSQSHSLPKLLDKRAQARGEMHPAFGVTYDTRVFASSGVECRNWHHTQGPG